MTGVVSTLLTDFGKPAKANAEWSMAEDEYKKTEVPQ
jgi:hypothetical protein